MKIEIFLAVILIGIGWAFTFVTYGLPRDWKRGSGMICPLARMAAFLIIAGFIINPSFPWYRKVEGNSPVYIIDASGSMGITDINDQSRFRRAAAFFPGESAIAAAESVRFIHTTDDMDSLSFALRTDLGRMIHDAIILRPDARRLILASDGIHNTGPEPVQSVRFLSREVSCVFIDDSGEPADARIERVSMPSILLPGQEFTADVVVAYSGPDSSQGTRAHLVLEGREIVSRPLILSPETSTSISFPFRFDLPGSSEIAVIVDSLPGEQILDNNRAVRSVIIRQRYHKCEMDATRPVHDGAFLYQALQADGGFTVQRSIGNVNVNPVTGDSIPEILILGLYDESPQSDLYKRSMEVLRSGGVLVLLGWPQGSRWSAVSPLWCSDFTARDGHVFKSARMVRSIPPVFGLDDGSRRPPQRIPGGIVGVSPRAEILGESDGKPVIAIQPWQRGYVLTWLGSDWWRWMLKGDHTGTIDWPGILRWLLTPEGRGRLRIHMEREPIESGVPVVIRLEAFSRGWESTSHGDALISIQSPSGSVLTTKRIRFSGIGPVAAQFPPLSGGSWIVSAVAILEGADTLKAEKTITVRDVSREFLRTAPDSTILKRLAVETGGLFMSLGDSTRMDSLLRWHSDGYKTVHMEFRSFWPAFLLLLILLSVEWWLRHRQGLP